MVLLGGQRVKTVASLSRSQWGNPDFCFTGWNMTESPQLKNWSFQNNQLVISTACFNLNCFSPCPWSGIILGMDSANERRCYSVTSSLIGWARPRMIPVCEWSWAYHRSHECIMIHKEAIFTGFVMYWSHFYENQPAFSLRLPASIRHITLGVITENTILVPYLEVKALQLIWSSGTHRFHLLAPVPLTIFRSKINQNWQCSGLKKNTVPITKKFFTRHDGVTVMTCVKFHYDR